MRILLWIVVFAPLLAGCTSKVIEPNTDAWQAPVFNVEYVMGMNQLAMGRLDGAESHFKRAQFVASGKEQEALARTGLGALALARGKYGKAEKELKAALKQEPKTGDAWVYLARTKLAQGDTLTAIAILQEARIQVPSRADIHGSIGLLEMSRGAYPQAVMYLERAVEMQPANELWLDALNDARVETGWSTPVPSEPAEGSGEAVAEVEEVSPTEEQALVPIDLDRSGDEEYVPTRNRKYPVPARPASRMENAAPLYITPSPDDLIAMQVRAQEISGAKEITRANLAVLLTVNGPRIEVWPALTDLPPDVQDHPDAQAIAVVLFAGWMNRFPGGSFFPDDPITRTHSALIFERQVRRYPALMREAEQAEILIQDVSQEHYAIPAIEAVVGSGLMPLDAQGNFAPDASLDGSAGNQIARQLARAVERGLGTFREDDWEGVSQNASP